MSKKRIMQVEFQVKIFYRFSKWLKNHWFLSCFGPPGRPKMTPRGPQMAHLDPRGRQEGPKRTSRRPRWLVKLSRWLVSDLSNGPGDLSDSLRWSRAIASRPGLNGVRGSLLSNCREIRSPWLVPGRPNLFHLKTSQNAPQMKTKSVENGTAKRNCT